MRFSRFSGKTTRRGQALAVTRACDNSSPLVNQLGVNTWIWQPVSRNILSTLSLFLSPSRVIFYLLLLRSSDRNVKRNHYSPYDIANIVNSLPALCGLSITLSVWTIYVYFACVFRTRATLRYHLNGNMTWDLRVLLLIYILIIFRWKNSLSRNGFEENFFCLSLYISIATSIWYTKSNSRKMSYIFFVLCTIVYECFAY